MKICALTSNLFLLLAFAVGMKSEISARAQDTTNSAQPIAQVKYIPQRADDIAWENDRIAHRIYGPKLSGKEWRGSGIDVWVKSVRYPILDKWYKHGHYHLNTGEGLDFYGVGYGRGCGGLGIWDGKDLAVSDQWASFEIKETGGDRTVFVVKYAPWKMSDGHMVSESRTFTLENGSNLTRMETTLTSDEPELTVGIGLCKRNPPPQAKIADKNSLLFQDKKHGVMAFWQSENFNEGWIGLGVIVPPESVVGFVEEKTVLNTQTPKPIHDADYLVLVKVKTGVPFTYRAGACWSKGLDFHSFDEWKSYLEKEASVNK